MSFTKHLRQPENWQDFETLCKKLWAEIWGFPETKKNGRSGQNQSGVDVWGMDAEKRLIGIQCKGKGIYSHSQFSEKEILQEVEKAIHFKPKLSKFYLATTALKDAKIEECVREININQLQKGLFEVHLFCWEDIVELIDEHKRTHDWYVNERKYQNTSQANFSFANDAQEMIVSPKFKNIITTYVNHQVNSKNGPLITRGGSLVLSSAYGTTNILNSGFNKSYFPVSFKIINTGTATLRDIKVNINFDGPIQDIASTNEKRTISILKNASSDLQISTEELSICFTPKNGVLVGSDYATSNITYLKTTEHENNIRVNWEILADGFKQTGILAIRCIPQIVDYHRQVNDPSQIGNKNKIIDFFEKTNP